MNRIPWNHIHFIGIGGAGMCGIALLVHESGVKVTGSDIIESNNTVLLRSKHITVEIGHNHQNITSPDIIVYSSAITITNPELSFAKEQSIKSLKRGIFLAKLSSFFPSTIAVTGSHGKTTVASMLAHILIQNNKSPAYLIGGRVNNIKDYATAGAGDILVAEADESDGTLSHIKCNYGIITNIDNDHFWNYHSIQGLFESFRRFAFSTHVLLTKDSPDSRSMFSDHKNCRFIGEQNLNRVSTLPLLGRHNRINALFAIIMAEQFGIDFKDSVSSMSTFQGVDRRLSLRYKSKKLLIYEDYAHHPNEVKACVDAIRERYPSRNLKLIFQPHRVERISHYCDELAAELGKADELYVIPVFKAWMKNKSSVSAQDIVKKINLIPAFFHDQSLNSLAKRIAKSSKSDDIILIMGAGDITEFVPVLIQEFA